MFSEQQMDVCYLEQTLYMTRKTFTFGIYMSTTAPCITHDKVTPQMQSPPI